MLNWLRNFMLGRYGIDQLSIAMFILYFLIWLVERIFGLWWFAFLTAALIILIVFRGLSRNIDRRRAENEWFLRFWSPVLAWWRNRGIRAQARMQQHAARKARAQEQKTYRFFTCAQCGQSLRVPRGKGKLRIRCPKCANEFEEKT